MEPTAITAAELTELLRTLGAPAVITKNVDPESEQNYRPRPKRAWEMLDGFWPGKPKQVSPGAGFAMHFVERNCHLWLGDYLGTVDDGDGSGIYSLIVGDPQCFRIVDLDFSDERQRELKKIFKKSGAVIYSYFDSATDIAPSDKTSSWLTYRMVEVKQRLHQRAFRAAVFAYHGVRCKVTGCTVDALLEAAHLVNHSWQDGDNSRDDGIPLRVDIHRAYDNGMIRFDDNYQVIYLDESLLEEYGKYWRR
ncbi:HNH endonuclease signature motif containing protein [Paraburkholderia sp. J7]|uniref:HNH endonuclease n=1 Tax=Paraburkholderia sp. J7 TaxID=2805438 RepID=UPI002AB665F6|nr:HNH endonuclease signature motif containing protein [Paraburkholderia sp. J7]